jgi:hypothetical protein
LERIGLIYIEVYEVIGVILHQVASKQEALIIIDDIEGFIGYVGLELLDGDSSYFLILVIEEVLLNNVF